MTKTTAPYYTRAEAAEIRGLTSEAIRLAIERGEIQTVTTLGGRQQLIPSEALKKWKPRPANRPKKK